MGYNCLFTDKGVTIFRRSDSSFAFKGVLRGNLFLVDFIAKPGFYAKTKYSSHVCPGSFVPHTRTKSVHIKQNVTNKVYLLHK
jgi:hypothetical protein